MGKKDGINKRGKTYWITFTDATGARRWESSKSKYYAAAEKLLAIRKVEAAQGKLPELLARKQQISFSDLATKYLEFCVNQRDIKNKSNIVNNILIPLFGQKSLSQITLSEIETFYNQTLSSLSPSTANRRLGILKNMFTKAVDWQLLPDEALRKIRKIKMASEKEGWRLRFLTQQEAINLLDSCSETLRPIVVTALNTGMRRGEIFDLTWDNVHFEAGFIYIRKSKIAEQRQIPISEELYGILSVAKKNCSLDATYVFPGKKGRLTDVKKSFATAIKIAEIDDFHFHDLRHTFASWLVMAGIDLTTVSRLLGHKSLQMTLRYAHLAPNHLQLAVAALPTLKHQRDISSDN
jgi:integrase